MQVSIRHAHIFQANGDYWLADLGSAEGTWLNGSKLAVQQRQRVIPGDEIEFGQRGSLSHTFKVKRVHSSVWEQLQELTTPDQQELAPEASNVPTPAAVGAS